MTPISVPMPVTWVMSATSMSTLMLATLMVGDGSESVDSHHHHGATGVVKVLTFQTIVAFLAFFGLGGLATQRAGRPDSVAVGVAIVCGLAAMWAVAYVMYGFHRLSSDPTVRLRRAVGCAGQVYLRIPASGTGEGKVTITLQERTVEMNAKTAGPELPTGADIVVTRLIDQQTLEVVAAESDRG